MPFGHASITLPTPRRRNLTTIARARNPIAVTHMPPQAVVRSSGAYQGLVATAKPIDIRWPLTRTPLTRRLTRAEDAGAGQEEVAHSGVRVQALDPDSGPGVRRPTRRWQYLCPIQRRNMESPHPGMTPGR